MSGSSPSTQPEYYIARVDRLPTWGLSYGIIWALALSFFMALYDVGNIGNALPYIPYILTASQASLVVSLGLIGYVVGAPLFSYFADIIGRRPMLIYIAIVTAIGSLGDAFAINYPMLAIFRFITGMGIGADLALVMTYIGEMSPAAKRGSYSNLAFIGGWAGLGFSPFIAAALVTSIPVIGWRIVFLIGGIIAIAIAIGIAIYAPESVRFLAMKGKFSEAEKILSKMEETSMKRARVTSLPQPTVLQYSSEKRNPFKILSKSIYLKRLILLVVFWFTAYIVSYSLTLLGTWEKYVLGYSGNLLAQAILYGSIGAIGTFLGAVFTRPFIDKADRRLFALIGMIGYLIGNAIFAYGGVIMNIPILSVGIFVSEFTGLGFFNFYYLMTLENFPTEARATGYALSDGVGHVGGAVGSILIIVLAYALGSITAWTIECIPAIIMAVLLFFFTPKTVGVRLEEVNEAMESRSQKV